MLYMHKTIFFILCLMISTSGLGQSLDVHKTYSGQFGNYSTGKATYSYILNENGERMFDGPFKYSDGATTYAGNFTKNRQTGKWVRTWVNKLRGPKAVVKTVTTVNFNDKGLLEGAFLIQDHYRSGKVVNVVKANFKNGFIDGQFEANDYSINKSEHKITGQFDMGMRIGKWTDSHRNGYVDYDNWNDYSPLVRTVNESTGDITEEYHLDYDWFRFDWNIQKFLIEHPYIDSDLLMRDSKIITMYIQNEFEFPRDFHVSGIKFEEGSGMMDAADGGNMMYEFEVSLPERKDNTKSCKTIKKNWSDWEDFLLDSPDLMDALSENPQSEVQFRLLIGPEGELCFVDERNENNRLKHETLRMLRRLQWNVKSSRKRHPMAICHVKVNYNVKGLQSIKAEIKKLEQEEAYRQSEDYVHEHADEAPQFPGGNKAMSIYLTKNIVLPESYLTEGSSGRIWVRFVVWRDGSVKNPEIVRGLHPDLDKEVQRVVSEFPAFVPAKINGKPVNVYYEIKIPFNLDN